MNEIAARLDTRVINSKGLPLVVDASTQGLCLTEWASEHAEWMEKAVAEQGALLLRGFHVQEPIADFEVISRIVSGGLLEYVYRSTPRSAVSKNIYTATEYPAGAVIPQHNENAYSRDWPLRLMFLCVKNAVQGGETPLSSTALVTNRISERTIEKFRALGVRYVRNYHDRIDLPWTVVFQTESREDVVRYCEKHDIQYEWRPDGSLRTSQVCQATARHPKTGEELWFNQAHLFHVSSLDAATRNALLSIFGEDDLPRNAYYGDGSPIESEVLDEIRAAFDAETVTFSWQKNDVLILDNMLICHGRRPFKGERKVLVSMGRPFSSFN